MQEPVIIFVGGVSRSGTSLFSQLLDGHPQLTAFSEEVQYLKTFPKLQGWRSDPEQYFLHMVGRPFDFERGENQPFSTPIDIDKNFKPFGPWNEITASPEYSAGDREKLLAKIREEASERELFLQLAEIYAKRVVGTDRCLDMILEKTPGTEFHFKRLKKIFPEARFLHLVRDPIDNLRSRIARKGQVNTKKINWLGAVNMAYEWKRSLLAASFNYQESPDRYRIIRYEDLIGDPERVMRQVCAFLGIEFDEIVLKQTRRGGRELRSNPGHEQIERTDGTVDQQALKIDSAEILGAPLTKAAASVLGDTYKLLEYRRYEKYFSEPLSQLARRHKGETLKQWSLRLPLSIVYSDRRIVRNWNPKILLS